MKRLISFTLAGVLLAAGLAGCGKKVKLTQQDKSVLQVAAIAAKERATAFDVMRDKIKPADPANAALIERFVAAHAQGLNAQAKGLADVIESIHAGSELKQQTRDMIAAEAATATARAENFAEVSTQFAPVDEAFERWRKQHQEALMQQAAGLAQFASALAAAQAAAEQERDKLNGK